jgi:hypothetical protein
VGDQWTPWGDVLRCVIGEGSDRMPLIHVDDRLDEEPETEVREPDGQEDLWQTPGRFISQKFNPSPAAGCCADVGCQINVEVPTGR